jgi:hypothetical protein
LRIEQIVEDNYIKHGEIQIPNCDMTFEIYDSKIKYLIEKVEKVINGVKLIVTRRTEWAKV